MSARNRRSADATDRLVMAWVLVAGLLCLSSMMAETGIGLTLPGAVVHAGKIVYVLALVAVIAGTALRLIRLTRDERDGR